MKRLIIWGVVILAAIVFYNKFMRSTMEEFFRKHSGRVDFMGVNTREPQVPKE